MTCSGTVQCGTDPCSQSCQTGNVTAGTNSAGACVTTVLGCFVERQPVTAQDVSRYRAYVLESSLDTVLQESGVREVEKTRTINKADFAHSTDSRRAAEINGSPN